MKKTKIGIFSTCLRFGGGERVGVNIANALAADPTLEVMLLVYDAEKSCFEVDERVIIRSIGEPLAIKGIFAQGRAFLRKVRKVEQEVNNEGFDYSISIMSSLNIITLFANLGDCRKIITEHNVANKSNWLLESITGFLKTRLYRKAYKIVAVSEGVKESLCRRLGPLSVDVIYNPIDLEQIKLKKEEKVGPEFGKYILGVGRLTAQKGFDLLLKGFAKMQETDIKLIILGEGEEKQALLQLAEELGVGGRVFFPGFVENPYKYMKNSACFVLSSRWEGFGLVLAEALASDAKVVSFDCESGPSEILEDGKYGELVPPGDVARLSIAIARTLNRARINPTESLKRFDVDVIAAKYRALLF